MDSPEDANSDLDPSELGTKEYWDKNYQDDLARNVGDGADPSEISELDSWFDDVGAPAKTLAFLTSESFPLSPNSVDGASRYPSVLDVGTGNGSTLLALRLKGGYQGLMVGIDYSVQSVRLARKLCDQYLRPSSEVESIEKSHKHAILFEVFDVIRDDPDVTSWWPSEAAGFDLVLDKGTFDAVCLASEMVVSPSGREVRPSELYLTKVARLVRPGGFFLITSCNWTQAEVIGRFTTGTMQGVLELYWMINYPSFQFGGQKGQGVASVCFRKSNAP